MNKNKNKKSVNFYNEVIGKFSEIFSNSKVKIGLLVGAIVIVVIIIILVVFYFINNEDQEIANANLNTNNENINKAVIEKVNDKYARKIDGILVDNEDLANPWIVGIMIENLTTVRPQSGLSAAPLVYETLAEGGITRFVAFFNNDENLPKIGPVRSARPYYIEWISEFDALYAHCGGSPTALAAISGLEINDLNQMWGSAVYYWRDTSRYAPHNLFTSSELINRALRDKSLDQESPDYFAWKFKSENPTSSINSEKTVYIDYSSGEGYDVEYRYDSENNDYIRYHYGNPHIDENTNGNIRTKNLIVQKVPAEGFENEKGRIILDVAGEGEAFIFIDGEKIVGKWKKENRTSRTYYYDQKDNEIEFNRGNTWVEVVPGDRAITYSE